MSSVLYKSKIRLGKYTGKFYNDLNKAGPRKGFLANPWLIRIYHSPKNTD